MTRPIPNAGTLSVDERICRICDGGPGNDGVCLCGSHVYEPRLSRLASAEPDRAEGGPSDAKILRDTVPADLLDAEMTRLLPFTLGEEVCDFLHNAATLVEKRRLHDGDKAYIASMSRALARRLSALSSPSQEQAGAVAWPDIASEGERLVRETYKPEGGGYLWTDVVGVVQTAIAEERARHLNPASKGAK